VSLIAITAGPPARLAPIVSVFDGLQTEIFLVGQWRNDAIFRIRTRVSDLRLRPPAIRIQEAVSVAGDSLAVAASYAHGRYSLCITTRSGSSEHTIRATPNWAWSYFMPFENYALGESAAWLTAFWVAGLLLPIGYWARRSGPGPWPTCTWGTVALTFTFLPLFSGLAPLQASEWLAALVGLGLGHLVALGTTKG
jgi:hypothetical protein